MSGKMLILLGLIVSALFMYFCISSKKETLYAELYGQKSAQVAVTQPATTTEQNSDKQTSAPVQAVVEKKDPSFAYVAGEHEKFAGFLSKKDQNNSLMQMIDNHCKKETCTKEIKFFEDIRPYHDSKLTFGIVEYAQKENLENFSLLIDKGQVKIEGTLKSKDQKDQLEELLAGFYDQGYKVEDQVIIKKPIVQKETSSREDNTSTPTPQPVTPTHISTDEAAKKINRILQDNTITFDYRSSSISKESKKTLDEVIDILFGLDEITIEVAGYTDSKGDAIYNKVLSQKRADSVANYLVESGIRSSLIKSVGYGEENPIADPKDIVNRRVEIHIKEGE